MEDNSIDLTITDIPYGNIDKNSNGLRVIDKKDANEVPFDIGTFLDLVYNITRSTVVIFCGREQFSFISYYFNKKQLEKKGTVRQLIWEKTNPSPMNGRYIYLSGIENIVWFKRKEGTFNTYCKNTVFRHPNGSSKLHPTEKNHNLLKELILDNSNENDLIFDPCCGSGSHLYVAHKLNRKYMGTKKNKRYYMIALERMKSMQKK